VRRLNQNDIVEVEGTFLAPDDKSDDKQVDGEE